MAHKPTNEIVIHTVYNRLKGQIVNHEFAPGERLIIEHLADQLDVSTIPVREALGQLATEGLISRIPKIGFFTKRISEAEIRNLYELNAILLKASLDKAQTKSNLAKMSCFSKISPIDNDNLKSADPDPRHLVKTLSDLFLQIAIHSCNSEIVRIIQNLNDKLNYIRRCEYEMIDDSREELLHFRQLYYKKQYRSLSAALDSYHDKHLLLLSDLIDGLR